MPRRKKNFRRKGKKKGHKKRHGKRFSLTVRRPSTLPDSMFVRLKYVQLAYKVMTAQNNTSLLFRGNSPYDPDFQMGGHSALGFDEWTRLFHNYRVHRSQIYIRLCNATQPMRMSICPTTVASDPPNIAACFEYPYSKSKTISSTFQDNVSIFNHMYTKEIFGIKSISYEDNLQSQYNTIPADQWYWKLFFSTYDDLTNDTVFVDVHILYSVEFFNRVELHQSGVITHPGGETGTQDMYDWTPVQVGSTGSSIGATGNPGLG